MGVDLKVTWEDGDMAVGHEDEQLLREVSARGELRLAA